MAPLLKVDDEVYSLLKEHAEPFVDTPNGVLRRLLGLEEQNVEGDTFDESPIRRKRRGGGKSRLGAGLLLPPDDYVVPLLQALVDLGGSGPIGTVTAAVGEALNDRFTAHDHTRNASGGIRWKNRTQWVRNRLVKDGRLATDSPRGVWDITDAGREHLNRLRGENSG